MPSDAAAAPANARDLADYLLDHYGSCANSVCYCNRDRKWTGRGCPSWRPLGATTWDELKVAAQKPLDI